LGLGWGWGWGWGWGSGCARPAWEMGYVACLGRAVCVGGREGSPRLAEGDGQRGGREARVHGELRVVGHLVRVRVMG
jgi:hypothetical protein